MRVFKSLTSLSMASSRARQPRRLLSGVGLSISLLSPLALAQSPMSFDISGYEVTGASRLSAVQVQELLAPYTGTKKTVEDINAARAQLQTALQRAGQTTAQVSLPEQTAGGPIRMIVTDSNGLRLKMMTISGANTAYPKSNIEASLPALQQGQLIDESQLERNLRLANLNPGKRTSVELRSGGQAGDDGVDAQVAVSTGSLLRATVNLNTAGDNATGRARLGLGLSHSNITNNDDVLSAQFITSPSNTNKIQVYALNYSVPIYQLNSQLEAYAAHSNAKVGLVQNLFNVNGQGNVFGARWNYLLPATQGVQWKASVGYDSRQYKNDVSFVGSSISLLPNVKVNPLSLGLSLNADQAFGGNGSVDARVFYSSNLSGGSSNAATFTAARAGAVPDYKMWKFNLGATLRAQPAISSWGARTQLTAQSSSNALVYGEQFGLGGMYSVRGYREGEFSADSGYSLRNELFTSNLVSMLPGAGQLQDFRVKLFADVGYGKRNLALPGEQTEFKPASVGLGLYVLGQQSWSLSVDVARVLKTVGLSKQGDTRGNMSLTKSFF